ncbi:MULTISPECIES: hypothetical protein [Leifsonia]|uniref:Uncharacterized protein n=1 Tax=Leifsonia soli TaxID=582665 RepID=A0A852SXR7_9MICO|nr:MULTISPECIES: hypothetical protein [Leifsonia]NYD73481.1 hypothetical protein [Leifsonia soli]SEA82594.1 hypothetical protein SAMN04515680_1705 [Leifsonia sp. 21MFCrub1.1]
MTVYLHDSQGVWIAFRSDLTSRDLFNPDGEWIGWFPWGDHDAVTPDGDYLGTVRGDRLFARADVPYRGRPGYPGAPAYAGTVPYPGAAPYSGLPDGCDDVASSLLWPRVAS